MTKQIKQKAYKYHDTPPLGLGLSVIIQSAVVATMNISVLLLVFRSLNISMGETINYIQLMLISYAIATFIQCLRVTRIGAGMFMPSCSPIVYLAPGLYAASIGGLSLMAGMMVFACFCELFLSMVIRKIRVILPKEICGLAFLIIGIQLGIIAFQKGFHTPELSSVFYFVIILSTIIFFNVWFNGIWKNLGSLYAVIIGVILYLAFPAVFSQHPHELLSQTNYYAIFSLPHTPSLWKLGFSFDFSLAPIFILTAFTAAIRIIGVALIANTYESDSAKPNYKIYQKAIRGDAISALISSLLTGLAINVSPVTTTLTLGAKCTSKVIAIGVIIIYLTISLSPFMIFHIASMPNLLIASVLMWYAVLLSISGLQVMQPNKFEIREYYSIGLPFIFAMTIWANPHIYSNLPKFITRMISNPLLPSLLIAIFLTLIFYIKSQKKINYQLDHKKAGARSLNKKINDLTAGKVHADILQYIHSSLEHLTCCIQKHKISNKPIEINISCSKMALNITLSYIGTPALENNMNKEVIHNLVEDEATYIGLKEYFRTPADQINQKINGNNVEYQLTYYLD